MKSIRVKVLSLTLWRFRTLTRCRIPQDSAARLTEVLEEQTCRVQELRRQLGSGSQLDAAAALQQEQNQEETRSRAEQLHHLSLKEEIIRVRRCS